jgi:membrane fusion protein, multidrug efflux system
MSSNEIPASSDDGTASRLRRLRIAGVIAVMLAAGVYAEGVASRLHTDRQLSRWTDAQAVPSVRVLLPVSETQGAAFDLPGRLEAEDDASIHSRVSGYVKAWYADIGAKVKRGQALAAIDTPDLDQQLAQAQADLAREKADLALADSTSQRWSAMLKQDSVSQQAADEKSSELAVKRADYAAGEANVRRLQALESFKTLSAPFDGVVTARHADIGALVSAGDTGGPELFSVASTAQLRLYVHLPQDYAGRVAQGMHVRFEVPERPGQTFDATVASSNDDIDAQSGTLLVQLTVDNRSGALIPGEYAQVRFQLHAAADAVRVPASALLFRGSHPQLAVVDANGRVALRDIVIGTDYGTALEIDSGVKQGDRVIDNPPDSIVTGEAVKVVNAGAGSGGPGHA